MFFEERAAVPEGYQWTTTSERKNVLVRIMSTSETILKWKTYQNKNTMETYSQKPVTFMYFSLNYCDDHVERILRAVKNVDHLFNIGQWNNS